MKKEQSKKGQKLAALLKCVGYDEGMHQPHDFEVRLECIQRQGFSEEYSVRAQSRDNMIVVSYKPRADAETGEILADMIQFNTALNKLANLNFDREISIEIFPKERIDEDKKDKY